MMSLLTLSADIRQNEIFKEKEKRYFCSHFHFTVDQNIFLSQRVSGHVAGDRARTSMSRVATRSSSLINSFIYVLCHKESFLYMKTETCINKNKSVACKVFHRLALITRGPLVL